MVCVLAWFCVITVFSSVIWAIGHLRPPLFVSWPDFVSPLTPAVCYGWYGIPDSRGLCLGPTLCYPCIWLCGLRIMCHLYSPFLWPEFVPSLLPAVCFMDYVSSLNPALCVVVWVCVIRVSLCLCHGLCVSSSRSIVCVMAWVSIICPDPCV